MFGQMMQMPLMISSLIRHADRYHGDTQIVSRLTEGGIHRYTYTDAHRRARQLARALGSQGVRPGERIGTLAWNNHRHLEIYYAVSGMGAVCATPSTRVCSPSRSPTSSTMPRTASCSSMSASPN